MSFVLAIAQYRRAGTLDGDEHWSLVVLPSPSLASSRTQIRIFQIVGTTHDYRYETKIIDILSHDAHSLCGGCSVGVVDGEEGVEWMESRLPGLRIVHNDKGWNCRNWIVDAVKEMQLENHEARGEGPASAIRIDEGFSHRSVKEKLKGEMELYEQAEDHFFERYFGTA